VEVYDEFAATNANWLRNDGQGLLTSSGSGPTNLFSSGTNTDVAGNVAPATTFTTNSLRFDTANTTLTLTGTNTLQSGGILITSNNIFGATISGGTLASGVNELIVHAYGEITINSSITASNGLMKTGFGTLTFGGATLGLTD
jgi:hypothetical protein